MKPEQCKTLFAELAEEFNRHARRSDGERVIGSLNSGLALLQNLLYSRLHEDVERIIGRDSMLVPVSELKTLQATKVEITLYQIAESWVTAGNLNRMNLEEDWCLRWLARLRLGESQVEDKMMERMTGYLSKTPHERRLDFTDVLTKVLPESRQAPLVLFELFPLSVQIVMAVALGDPAGASELRHRQSIHLPAIADCRLCRGQVLENGAQCQVCGNPLWKHEWLVAE
jgi:hypothetical protein